jgi:hypothetical protein
MEYMIISFFYLAAFQLLRLTYSDIKNLLVDERPSHFMMGVVVFCFILSGRVFEGLIVILFFSFALGYLKRFKSFVGVNEGDITVLSWICGGLWFVGWLYLAIFLACYILGLLLINIKLKAKNIPLLVVIFVAFIIAWIGQTLMFL